MCPGMRDAGRRGRAEDGGPAPPRSRRGGAFGRRRARRARRPSGGRRREYDAIVLDVMLPGIDGFEVCRRLRESGVWSPSSCSLRATRSRTASRASTRARTTTSRSRSRSPSCSRASRARPSRLGSSARRPRGRRPEARPGDAAGRGAARPRSSSRAKEFALLETFMRRPGQVLSRLSCSSTPGTTRTRTARTSSTSTSATCAKDRPPVRRASSRRCAARLPAPQRTRWMRRLPYAPSHAGVHAGHGSRPGRGRGTPLCPARRLAEEELDDNPLRSRGALAHSSPAQACVASLPPGDDEGFAQVLSRTPASRPPPLRSPDRRSSRGEIERARRGSFLLERDSIPGLGTSPRGFSSARSSRRAEARPGRRSSLEDRAEALEGLLDVLASSGRSRFSLAALVATCLRGPP